MSEMGLNSPIPDRTTSAGGGVPRAPSAHESVNQTASCATGGMMPFPMQMPFVFAPMPQYPHQSAGAPAFAIPRTPMMVMAAPAAAYFPPSTNVNGASHPCGAVQQQPLVYMPVAGQLGAGQQFHQFYNGMPAGGCGYFLVPAASVGRVTSSTPSVATSPPMPSTTQPSSAQPEEGVAEQAIKVEGMDEGLSKECTATTTIGEQPVPIGSNESVLAEIEKKLAGIAAGSASTSPSAEVKPEQVTDLQPTTTSTPACIPQPVFIHAMPYFPPMPSAVAPPLQPIHTNSSVVRLRATTTGPRPQTENICSNCQTKVTSLWRRSKEGNVECNACNLYHKLNGIPRPPHYKDRGVMKRSRVPPNRGQFPPPSQPTAVVQPTVITPAPTHQVTETTEEMQQCAVVHSTVKKEDLAEQQPVVEPKEETDKHGGGGAVTRAAGKKRRAITHYRGLRKKIIVVRKTGKSKEK